MNVPIYVPFAPLMVMHALDALVESRTSAHSALERALEPVASATSPAYLRRLIQPLAIAAETLRRALPQDEWKARANAVREHPAFERLQQDPYTHRAFSKPRGYAGDAVMLEYIYRPIFTPLPTSSWVGEAVYSYTCEGPAARAVRNRRTILARTVDELALVPQGHPLRMASLACGHLREAELMASLDSGRVERFWALDQDPLSVAECESIYHDTPIEPVEASVVDLLRDRLPEVNGLDLFYAAGLFDYLNDRLARRLLAEMFTRVRPGGRLLVANFTPETGDRGYMEAFMDWWLIFRTEAQMLDLAAGLAPVAAAFRTFREAEGNIVFLELAKR